MDKLGKILNIFSTKPATEKQASVSAKEERDEGISKTAEKTLSTAAKVEQGKAIPSEKVVKKTGGLIPAALQKTIKSKTLAEITEAKKTVPVVEQQDFGWIGRLAAFFDIKISVDVFAWITRRRQGSDTGALLQTSLSTFAKINNKSEFKQFLQGIEKEERQSNFGWIRDFSQQHKIECKRKMIMSPFSKVEMSPLLGFMAWEVLYGREGANEYQRS